MIVTAVGTGGTLAGIAAGLPPGRRAIGVSALRGAYSLDETVTALHREALGRNLSNWSIDHDHHHGGFARRSPELDAFLVDVERRHGLWLDHVYVGKMLFRLSAVIWLQC